MYLNIGVQSQTKLLNMTEFLHFVLSLTPSFIWMLRMRPHVVCVSLYLWVGPEWFSYVCVHVLFSFESVAVKCIEMTLRSRALQINISWINICMNGEINGMRRSVSSTIAGWLSNIWISTVALVSRFVPNHQLKAKCKQLDKRVKDKLPSRLCPQCDGGPFLTLSSGMSADSLYSALVKMLGPSLNAGCSFAS